MIGKTAIINGTTNSAYVLPENTVFDTGTSYTTFKHSQLKQLNYEMQKVVSSDLRASDYLRLEIITSNNLPFLRIVLLATETL